jgi:hypothetical protein
LPVSKGAQTPVAQSFPRSASGGQNARTPQSLTARASDGASSSLLTIGDILGIYSNNFVRRQAPKVEINGVNFVRNRAQGGNGVRGAGGGLGAGGAITFLEGTLKISNSVFQDLNASAGSGGPWANGGNGTFQATIASPIRRNSDGQSGGDGGISSIPYSRDVSGVMAYSAPRVAGGAGGRAGVEDSGGSFYDLATTVRVEEVDQVLHSYLAMEEEVVVVAAEEGSSPLHTDCLGQVGPEG